MNMMFADDSPPKPCHLVAAIEIGRAMSVPLKACGGDSRMWTVSYKPAGKAATMELLSALGFPFYDYVGEAMIGETSNDVDKFEAWV